MVVQRVPLGDLIRRFHSEYFNDEDLGSFGSLAKKALRSLYRPTGSDRDGGWCLSFFSGECNSSRAIYSLKVNIQHLMTKAFPLLRRAMGLAIDG